MSVMCLTLNTCRHIQPFSISLWLTHLLQYDLRVLHCEAVDTVRNEFHTRIPAIRPTVPT